MSRVQGTISGEAQAFTVVLPWVRKGHTEDFLCGTLTKSGLGTIQNTKWTQKAAELYGWFYEVEVEFKTFPHQEVKEFLENAGVIKVFFNQKNFWKIRAKEQLPRPNPKAPILIPHMEFPLRVHSVYTHTEC